MIFDVEDKTEALSLGLPYNENHRIFGWSDGEHTVYFSGCFHGNLMSIHLAADRKSRIACRTALNEFCESILNTYDECIAIVGAIRSQSVINLAKKCGFKYLSDVETESGEILPLYMRQRK